MQRKSGRRQFLRVTLAASVVGLAGCSGDGETTTDSEDADERETTVSGPDGGVETTAAAQTTAEPPAETTAEGSTEETPTDGSGGAIENVTGRYEQFQVQSAHTGYVPDASIPDSAVPQWSYPASESTNRSVAGPLLVDGTLYACVDDGESRLVALDAASGTLQYEAPVSGVLGMPAYADGTIYNPGQRIQALDAADGSEQWSVRNPYGFVPLTLSGESLYASNSTEIIALSTGDGSQRWTATPTQGDFTSTQAPAVEGDRLYTGAATVTALDTADGSLLWETDLDSPVTTSPTVADGRVFVGTDEGTVHGLDAADGTEVWSANPETSIFGLDTDFAYAEGTLVVPGPEGTYAYDVDAETERWQSPVEASSPPVVAGDTVLALGFDGVVALRLSDGSRRWQAGSTSTIVGTPVPVGVGSGVFVPLNGRILALG